MRIRNSLADKAGGEDREEEARIGEGLESEDASWGEGALSVDAEIRGRGRRARSTRKVLGGEPYILEGAGIGKLVAPGLVASVREATKEGGRVEAPAEPTGLS